MTKTFRIILAAIILYASLLQGQFSNDFSIGIIGDSQFLCSSSTINRFNALTGWLKDHADSLNIAFITQVGDIINNSGTSSQWEYSKQAMTKIKESGIPWGMAPGNHDVGNNYDYYNTHFGLSWWQGESWFGGNYPAGKSQNQYQIFTVQGRDFLWLHLENQAPNSAITWAQGIIDQYPGRIVFVTTHDYTSERGFETYGNTLWTNLITKNENIVAVICGHQYGTSYIQRNNDANKPVHNILVDYQAESDSYQGAVRWMEFNFAENKAYVYTMNPYLNNQMLTNSIRPNSFTGWAATLAAQNPALAHHENRYVIESFFHDGGTSIASNSHSGPSEVVLLTITPKTKTFTYTLKRSSAATLVVYNLQGRTIRTLVNEHKQAGTYKLIWDGKDNTGGIVSSGHYMARLVVDSKVESKSFTIF